MGDQDQEDMMWLEEEEAPLNGVKALVAGGAGTVAAVGALGTSHHICREEELAVLRSELAEVRKELAAKTVELAKRSETHAVLQSSVLEEKVHERIAEMAAEKETHLQDAFAQVAQLQFTLAQKEEELDESRRLYTAQKRALRDALNAASEKEATEKASDEASRTAAAAALEEEIEHLQHELAITKARSGAELRAREVEVAMLKQQLEAAAEDRERAVAEAETEIASAWRAEGDRLHQEALARQAELEGEVVRLMTQMEDIRREDASTSLSTELAALNKQKVQVQREFEAYKDMMMQTSRSNREEVSRLLEANAMLHSRLAAKTMEGMAPAAEASYSPSPKQGKVFEPPGGSYWKTHLPEMLVRLERQRNGIVPLLILGTLLVLVLSIAVTRAALSARHQHRGVGCMLSNLGIRIGSGCEVPGGVIPGADGGSATAAAVVKLLDETKRVHDVADVTQAGDIIAGVGATGGRSS